MTSLNLSLIPQCDVKLLLLSVQ